MKTFLSLCLTLVAMFLVRLTTGTGIDGSEKSNLNLPVAECPVCFCQWSGYRWRPVAATCGECECSEYMCSVQLKPPLAGSPWLCPWYGCPSGMPGPPPPSPPDDSTTSTTTVCPLCNCKWMTDKWLPVEETHGPCECDVNMCTIFLKPPNAGQPLECPWYGCPSGMPGPSWSS